MPSAAYAGQVEHGGQDPGFAPDLLADAGSGLLVVPSVRDEMLVDDFVDGEPDEFLRRVALALTMPADKSPATQVLDQMSTRHA